MSDIRRILIAPADIDEVALELLLALDGLSVAQAIVVLDNARSLLQCGTAFDARAAGINLLRQEAAARDPSPWQ